MSLAGERLKSAAAAGVGTHVQVSAPPVPNPRAMAGDDPRTALDERLLVERAQRDPQAFTQLYRAYVARIHAFAYRRTGSHEAAEEVTAVTFERAWRALPTFAWKGGGFEPWLFRIAANELVNHHRRRAVADSERLQRVLREMADELRDDPSLAAILEADEHDRRLAAIRAALSKLPARYQEAITLRYLSGLTTDEAAATLGCSKPTLAVVLHRALRALRQQMA
jgi:RNA polymerase sigma-70 factor (ECF subfamily)